MKSQENLKSSLSIFQSVLIGFEAIDTKPLLTRTIVIDSKALLACAIVIDRRNKNGPLQFSSHF